jgi:zinc ribbon protein
MIIFGTKTYLYTLAMLTLVCGRCGNPAAHALKKRVVKFSLFFVPLFPINTKYLTQCTFCGAGQQITKEQAEQLQATPVGYPQQQAASAPAMPNHQHPTA